MVKGSFTPCVHENWWENHADCTCRNREYTSVFMRVSVSFYAHWHQFSCALVMCSVYTNDYYQWLFRVSFCPCRKLHSRCRFLRGKKTHVVVWTGHSENHFLSALAECMQKNVCLCTMAWTKPQSFPLHPELKCLARHCKENMYWVNIKAAIDYQS